MEKDFYVFKGHLFLLKAFMEMEQWDCAAAMLERYLARPPNIKSCPVDVQRSNYPDLQLKSEVLFFSSMPSTLTCSRKQYGDMCGKAYRNILKSSHLNVVLVLRRLCNTCMPLLLIARLLFHQSKFFNCFSATAFE